MALFTSNRTDRILEKSLSGERISAAEALELYEHGDHLKIAAAARRLRGQRVDPDCASYTMFRIVNYTNYCNVDCTFCSFKEETQSGKGYTLSADQVIEKMEEVEKIGVDQIFLQGGVNPELPFEYYLDLLRRLRRHFGAAFHIRAFSPVELLQMEAMTGMELRDLLRELKVAGLDSVPGAGAEILSERMREILSPRKAAVDDWVRVMECCHEEGLPGTANVVFGSEETMSELIHHLEIVRTIQDRTGGFLSFIPWTFQQQTKRFRTRNVPAHEYLKVIGISRIFLDNIDHIEASIMVLGPGVGGLALLSGADDISSVVIEENVLRNHSFKSEERTRAFIRDLGLEPVRRDLLYRAVEPSSV